MTRLTTSDLSGIGRGQDLYDKELLEKTGLTLRQIACRAAGIGEEQILRVVRDLKVGMIPITAGAGTIWGFTQAVRNIASHLGFTAFVTERFDVAGFAEAIERRADVVLMADDERFVAVNLLTRRVVDNTEATGRGYGAALERLAKGVCDRRVLIIGAGRVGAGATRILKEMGAQIGVCDCERTRAEWLAGEIEGVAEDDLDRALNAYTILVDACPASGIIDARHIKPSTVVAAPGISLGLTDEARLRVHDRLIHDPLQIGVATMVISAARP